MKPDDQSCDPRPVDERWSEVENLGRFVDLQLECVRSVLVATDRAPVDGPLGSPAASAAAEVAQLGAGIARWPIGSDPIGHEPIAIAQAVARCFVAISELAAHLVQPAPPPAPSGPIGEEAPTSDEAVAVLFADVVAVLADDVTERYRRLLSAWATRSPALALGGTGVRLPMHLYVDQFTQTTNDHGGDDRMAVEAIRSAATWVAIAGQVAEAAAWLAAWHILSGSDIRNEPMALPVGGTSSDPR